MQLTSISTAFLFMLPNYDRSNELDRSEGDVKVIEELHSSDFIPINFIFLIMTPYSLYHTSCFKRSFIHIGYTDHIWNLELN